MLFLTMARSFLRAVLAMRHGEVTGEIYELRQAACRDCEKKVEYPQDSPKGVYCGACGCPQWFMSDLRTKTRMAGVRCPLDKW